MQAQRLTILKPRSAVREPQRGRVLERRAQEGRDALMDAVARNLRGQREIDAVIHARGDQPMRRPAASWQLAKTLA